MTGTHEELQRKIAEMEAQITALKAAATAQPGVPATPAVTFTASGQNYGQQVAINLGTMIYGRDPREDERRQLIWYLDALAAKLNLLPLQGLATRLDQRGEGVALSSIYVMLATKTEKYFELYLSEMGHYYKDFDPSKHHPYSGMPDLATEHDPDYALPRYAIVRELAHNQDVNRGYFSTLLVVTDAVQQNSRLVLLGHPGSGKSTFIRHLAWMLARHQLGYPVSADELSQALRAKLPIILSLRKMAGALEQHSTIFDALKQEIEACNLTNVDSLLREALHSGAALLLFDGLDEVPIDGEPGMHADRQRTLRAVRDFAAQYPQPTVVLTCRTRAFDNDLRELLGWPVEELAPFTLGQIRHFVPAWFSELVAKGHLERRRADALSAALIQAIIERPRLREMAETPLLLTMMASVLYNKNELPRDRPQLYEVLLNLLLGHWDSLREGQTLSEVIGATGWDSERIRLVLDQLSYTAHLTASSQDGRGRLSRATIEAGLRSHFEESGMRRDVAAGAAVRCLEYIEQRSGMLVPDDNDSFVFAHLTLQEHCAGRALVLSRDVVKLMLQHRSDDRWREPIILGLGFVQQVDPFRIESVLRAFIDRDEGDEPKPIERWYRDLILAAEIGADRDWGYLRQQQVMVGPLQRDLKRGLVALLNDKTQSLPVRDRVRAGSLLGDLGDPRVPAIIEEWQDTIWHQRNEIFGQSNQYWCYVSSGTYTIGGWREEDPRAVIDIPAFWIAQFPVTVAQYRLFIDAGGYRDDVEHRWTPNGWAWKQQNHSTQPRLWDDKAYQDSNLPILSATWYEAMAFTAWLTEQLVEILPPEYVIRLPTEAEWEIAAAYNGAMQRTMYPWGEAAPTAELFIADTGGMYRPTPVGVCPAGRAACGASDMASSVFEWIASKSQMYPAESQKWVADFDPQPSQEQWDAVLCNAWWWNKGSFVGFSERGLRSHPDFSAHNFGFRLVLAPRHSTD